MFESDFSVFNIFSTIVFCILIFLGIIYDIGYIELPFFIIGFGGLLIQYFFKIYKGIKKYEDNFVFLSVSVAAFALTIMTSALVKDAMLQLFFILFGSLGLLILYLAFHIEFND